MPTSPIVSSHHTVSAKLFEQLNDLLQVTASGQGSEFYIVTEKTEITRDGLSQAQHFPLISRRFTLVASESFSGLLFGQQKAHNNNSIHYSKTATLGKDHIVNAQGSEGNTPELKRHSYQQQQSADKEVQPNQYLIDLTFEPKAIATFTRELANDLPLHCELQHTLRKALTLLQTNSPGLQTEFTLELVHLLSKPSVVSEQRSYQQQIEINQSVESQLVQRTQVLHNAMLAAQAADQAKSEFLAAMSHELRTPLTYILGMSATLLRWSNQDTSESSQDALHERQHQYLQNIHGQGEHLLELINDILDLSQLESGKLGLDIQDFSISLLVQQTLKSYSDKARGKNIRLELDIHIPPNLDQFTADPRRIRQVILNLLSNAVKFTNSGGCVTLRASATESSVILQVKDTGIGIPDHLRADIFQKFRQLDGSYRRQYEGTGLGLALTKQLVDLHSGRIECHSTLDVGTVFTVTFPRTPFTQANAEEPRDLGLLEFQPLGRVVLIENHEESAHFVSDMLMAAGYQLIWMLEGLSAVSQIEVLQPSIIIVGTNLMDTDSCEIISQLRLNPLTKHLKIIAIGAERTLYDRSTYEDAGVDDFLVYPMHPEELLNRVGLAIANPGISESDANVSE